MPHEREVKCNRFSKDFDHETKLSELVSKVTVTATANTKTVYILNRNIHNAKCIFTNEIFNKGNK